MTRDRLNEEPLAIREKKAWIAFFVARSDVEAVFLSDRIFVLSATPGRPYREVAVDLPAPRTEETRQSREYQTLVAEASKLLHSVERGVT